MAIESTAKYIRVFIMYNIAAAYLITIAGFTHFKMTNNDYSLQASIGHNTRKY